MIRKPIPSSLVERYRNGESGNVLAREMGVSGSTFYGLLRESGEYVRSRFEARRKIRVSDEELERMYRGGMSFGQISLVVGVSRQRVHQRLSAYLKRRRLSNG